MRLEKRSSFFSLIIAISFVIIGSLSNTSFAQKGILEGTIYDKDSGETIPYANIVVDGTLTGTYSNEEGKYRLSLNEGLYSIRYSSISYTDTLVSVNIRSNEASKIDIYLSIDALLMDEIVVSADRVARKVQQLADLRDKHQTNLKAYTAKIYKLAILGTIASGDTKDSTFNPVAFSERESEFMYTREPQRYSEVMIANRASKNFFSEYDYFSTGGQPLDLNQEMVPLSILSEGMTIPGPISKKAGNYYILSDNPADSTWPDGTVEIIVKPRFEDRPLFEGKVWYDDETSTILGVDVGLNDYTKTNTGIYSVSDLHYKQSYVKIDGFWLPKQTKLSAKIKIIGSGKSIRYRDEWTWKNHKVNPSGVDYQNVDLNTLSISENAHLRSETYWDTLSTKSGNENLEYLEAAKTSRKNSRTLNFGMALMSKFFRLPYQLERFYLTNMDDIYHFNRVEGHYLGVGLRTPYNPDYEYRFVGGYSFTRKTFNYKISGLQYIGRSGFAPEFSFRDQVAYQFQDYDYNTTPLDFFGFRQTMQSLLYGAVNNNYFEREGFDIGFRVRFRTETFFRLLYTEERHRVLNSRTDFHIFGSGIERSRYANNDILFPAQPGDVKGIYAQFHHDTRKYRRAQFLRDYNNRSFGWLTDLTFEKGISSIGSDFDYARYRLGLKMNVPIFSSHFIQADMIVGASDSGTPNQRLFSYNGFVLDDYVREQYVNTTNFKTPIGSRVSEIKLKYKFGSSITRKTPIKFIQQSGIHLSLFMTVATVDDGHSMVPLLPGNGGKTQAELGIAAFKIFGFIYAEFSRRLVGEYGNTYGFQILF